MSRVEVVPLGEVVKPSRPRVKPSDHPNLPFIGMEHVEAHSMKLLGTVPAATMKSAAVHFKPGDVLYGRLRPYLNKVYRPTFEGLCSAEFIVFPENERVDGGYLQYFLNSSAFVRFASHLNTGDRPRVDFDQLAPYEIPLPEIDEQRRIVAEIEKQFSRLDEAVANLKRVKASILRYQAAVLSEAAVQKGRWTTCTIADLLRERIVNGLSVKESTTPTSVRALRLSAITESGLNYADHRFLPVDPASVGDILVEEGDFFVSRGNGSLALVGRGAIAQTPPFPVIFPDTMMRLRFAAADIRRWVAMLWHSRLVRRQIEQRVKTTAGIYKIAQPQVASIRIPLPPAPERERIVAEVDRRLSIVREVEAEIDANLKRAQALRQAVLARAFAGANEAVPSAA